MNFDNFVISKDYIASVHNNVMYNKTIIDYFKKLKENEKNISKSVISCLDSCNKYWLMDVYELNAIKDFVSTNLCKNKFCNNCKKVKQATRMSRYIPELEQYKNNLYHITFTLPNVPSEELKNTIKLMSKAFRQLMRYINGNDKLKFLNFNKYGYKGAVRSLEITFNENSYHPHYHCAFVFTNLKLNKIIKNKYSIDHLGIREDNLFSEFEIILQKLWYLILNRMEVNSYNFETLEDGYSVNCEQFNDNDYAELFKYMTKETDEKNNILTYDNFFTLYKSTYNLKQIQGYGCLYRIQDLDLDEEVDKIYADMKEILQLEELPKLTLSSAFDLLVDNDYKIISRKKIYQYLRQI